LGFGLSLAVPEQLSLNQSVLDWAAAQGADVTVTRDADEACTDADLIVTDTWVSMGDEDADARNALLQPYQVDARRMGLAHDDALFMHCLPAHRDEEVTSGSSRRAAVGDLGRSGKPFARAKRHLGLVHGLTHG